MPNDRLVERLQRQVPALKAKVQKEHEPKRQRLLLSELIAVVYALECAQLPSVGSHPSVKERRRTLAARRGEMDRNYAATLAHYVGTVAHHATRTTAAGSQATV